MLPFLKRVTKSIFGEFFVWKTSHKILLHKHIHCLEIQMRELLMPYPAVINRCLTCHAPNSGEEFGPSHLIPICMLSLYSTISYHNIISRPQINHRTSYSLKVPNISFCYIIPIYTITYYITSPV